ncbi:MAG: HD domain-containing protein [Bacteroidota bacterium]|nr:phosphohydrolase [Odoribacter sp.]MDP3642153.1 HD domain-containing protein [Bacteroidota bacterium]
MDHKEIIQSTGKYVAHEFCSEGSGHDWFHIDRVRKMAVRIGIQEKCDLFVTEMAALLHDLDDWKITDSESTALSKTETWLNSLNVETAIAAKIIRVIDEVSYKGANISTPVSSVESAVVQDADRLDAIGAIGIARTFSYGGYKNRLIYDPEVPVDLHDDFRSYKKSAAPTINHFYEKLLLLKDRMNTQAAQSIAEGRHQFMVDYLSQFFDEWEAKR